MSSKINKKDVKADMMDDFFKEDDTEDKVMLKELFQKEDINIKTEFLSIEETGNYAKYQWLAAMPFMKKTKLYLLLGKNMENRLSNRRRSRKEFLEGFKHGEISTKSEKQGFFDRFRT